MLKINHLIGKPLIQSASIWVLASFFLVGCSNPPIIENPYEQVDWNKYEQYKANFHTHTTMSDGYFSPQKVVDMYKEHGYSILALTDHNRITFPWTNFESLKPSENSVKRSEEGKIEISELTFENRNPEEMGIIAIQGSEISSPQHLGSYYTDVGRLDEMDKILIATKEKDGLIIFNHPGRYESRTTWYATYFREYDHIIGLEVFNHGNRYVNDKQLWDSVLVKLMPERPVWGYSNDDFHAVGHGRNWNMMILAELSSKEVKRGLINGHSFFIYAPLGHNSSDPPVINSIHVNNKEGLIKINCIKHDSIQWISSGQVIENGEEIRLKGDFKGDYVRAEIYGKDGTIVGTQPFGIKAD